MPRDPDREPVFRLSRSVVHSAELQIWQTLLTSLDPDHRSRRPAPESRRPFLAGEGFGSSDHVAIPTTVVFGAPLAARQAEGDQRRPGEHTGPGAEQGGARQQPRRGDEPEAEQNADEAQGPRDL